MEARRAAQELSEALIPSILDGLGQPAIVLDLERRIVTSNQKYRDRFFGGKNPSGRCCFEISHRYSIPCDHMGESCPWTTAKASGERARSLHVHHTSEGERHETVSVYPLFDPDGRVRFFLEILAAARFSSAGAPGDATLVGFSAPFTRMLDLVSKVAATSTAVLLLGESGTGKDLVAGALHYLSARARGAFVPLDCSGLTETLFESELFGHEKGVFTGVVNGLGKMYQKWE